MECILLFVGAQVPSRERKKMSNDFLTTYPYKNKPYLHQQAYLERFWDKRLSALFADTGTGKTYMVINNFCMLYDRGDINAVLIIAPKGVYRNWYSLEIPKHMPAHVVYKTALWSPTPTASQSRDLFDIFSITDDLKILIMNVEAFSTEKGTKFASRFILAHDAFVAIDESTSIKNPAAKRSKNVVKAGQRAKYKRIMTGSPVTKSPMDLFQQCGFLSFDLLGHLSFYTFQARYAVVQERTLATHSFKQIVGYQRLDDLQQKLTQFSFRVTKDECLDLPAKTFLRREVELTTEQRRIYEQMRKMALAALDGGIVSTVNALTQIMRLQQIVCGHVTLDNGEIVPVPSNRLDELMAAIQESSGKIIIWAHFRHDIVAIRTQLQKTYGMTSVATYYGDTPDEERPEIVAKFQDPSSELRFFVGQPRTGGYGLTLTEAHTMIYYSNGYDLEVRLQSEARIDRMGQKNKMTYIDLVSPKTVDEKIVDALLKKMDIANQVMGEKAKEWLQK
jgi:SNF2 family DNA or RNA helicase